MIARPILAF
jgi:hypothetical protein